MNLVHQSHTTVTGTSQNMNIFTYQVLQITVPFEADNTIQNPAINVVTLIFLPLVPSNTTVLYCIYQ